MTIAVVVPLVRATTLPAPWYPPVQNALSRQSVASGVASPKRPLALEEAPVTAARRLRIAVRLESCR